MKKLFLIGIFLIAVLISGCVESPETQTANNDNKDVKERKIISGSEQVKSSETTQTTSKEKEVQSESVPTPEPKQEIVYSVNEDVNVDYLTYKATKTETFTEMGTSFLKKETNGKFVKVYLDITNNAKETKDIFSPRFTLIDYQDRKYERLSNDILYIADGLELGKQVQPGLTTSGAIVFELPKDSKDLVLVIRGDWLSVSEVKVVLSNIKNIGKDTTQKEEQEEIMDEAMSDAQEQIEDLMNQCNTPYKCSSNCAAFSDVGQKDCHSGQVCCLTEQSEVDQQMEEITEQAQQQVENLMNRCNSPFRCTSSCSEYMNVGQKNCPTGQFCCME